MLSWPSWLTLYSGKVRPLPKGVCVCVDDDCSHEACRPAVWIQKTHKLRTSEFKESTKRVQRVKNDIIEWETESELEASKTTVNFRLMRFFFFSFICFLSNQTRDMCTRFVNFTLFNWIVLVPILGFWKLINFVLFISSIMKLHVDQLKIIYNDLDLVLCLILENMLWKVFKVK